jgi:hypothetical protein
MVPLSSPLFFGWTISLRKKIVQLYFFLKFFVIKTLDPDPEHDLDPDSLKMLDPHGNGACVFVRQTFIFLLSKGTVTTY